jgi:hypothetical protein
MQFLARYLQNLLGQTRAVAETCLYGLAAGIATVAFQLGMNWLCHLGLMRLSHQSMTTFLIGSFCVIVNPSARLRSSEASATAKRRLSR